MELTQFYTWACLLLSFVLSKISLSGAQPTFVGDRYDRYGVDYGYGDSYGSPAYRNAPYGSTYGSGLERANKDYVLSYGQPLTQERLNRLRKGYYYVDDGYIAEVPNDISASSSASSAAASRRQDADGNLPDNLRFQPLVRYKQTKTKRKKLFVPNLFG